MPTREEYAAQAEALGWADLRKLWNQIKLRHTPNWPPGKAFEYLILRAFQLDGGNVHWPYSVTLYGQAEIIEEIDFEISLEAIP